MRKNSTMNRAPKSVTRRRAAIVTGGLVAALALGSTAALAADAQHEGFLATGTATSISDVVQKQASGQKSAAEQQKAAAAKAKAAAAKTKAANEAKAKAAADAKKRAEAKAAADRKARSASWETPVSKYVIGASYAQAGSHWAHTHSGQDFVVSSGTSVRAAHTGTVVTAGWGGAYGNNIVIKHSNNTYSQYGHLSHIGVHVGQSVTTGQEIGKSGSTGNSTGPHLHFEIRKTPYYGSSVEPLHFLRTHGVHV